MSKQKDFRCMESQLRTFLTLPRPTSHSYKMPKEAETTIKQSVQKMNTIFPQLKLKASAVIDLVKQLYVHPPDEDSPKSTSSKRSMKKSHKGGAKGTHGRLPRLTRKKKKSATPNSRSSSRSSMRSSRSRSKSRSRSNRSNEIVELEFTEPKSSLMSFDVLMAIFTLLASIYLAYVVYIRVVQLNDLTNVSGHVSEMKSSIVEEFKKMGTQEQTFLSFWFQYFKNVSCNIIQKEANVLKDLVVNIGKTVAEKTISEGQVVCNMNPESTVDWVTSYMNPSGVTQCLDKVRSSVTTIQFATVDLLTAEIQKNASDVSVLANSATSMATGSIGYLMYRMKPARVHNVKAKVRKSKGALRIGN